MSIALADTVKLERSILKLLCTQPMVARMWWGRANSDWMTTPERKFIFELGKRKYSDQKSVLTDQLVVREIKIKLDKKEWTHYRAEWKIIVGLKVSESPEALTAELERSHLAFDTIEITGEIEDLIRSGDIDEAIALAKEKFINLGSGREPHENINYVEDYKRRKKLVEDKKKHPERYLGLRTGFKEFDRLVGGLFKAELTLLAAVTGVGKSTLMKAWVEGLLRNNKGKNILYITNEETEEQVLAKFDAVFTGIPQRAFKRPDAQWQDVHGDKHDGFSDEEFDLWEETIEDIKTSVGHLIVREVPAFSTVIEIQQAYYELTMKGTKIHCIVYDYIGRLKPVQKVWGENDEDDKKTAELHDLARTLNIPILSAAQAATIVAKKQEKGQAAGDLDVHGGKGQIHNVNNFIIITRVGQDNTQTMREEWERDWFWECDVKKQRDGPRFKFYSRHEGITGRVIEVPKAIVYGGGVDPSAGSSPASIPGSTSRVSDEEIKELEKEAGVSKDEEPEKPPKKAKRAVKKGKRKGKIEE